MDNSRSLPLSGRPAPRTVSVVADSRIRLRAGECWSPHAAQPLTLVCTEGSFWWTQPGDTRDHLLRAGQRLTVGTHNGIVLQALTGAELVVATG